MGAAGAAGTMTTEEAVGAEVGPRPSAIALARQRVQQDKAAAGDDRAWKFAHNYVAQRNDELIAKGAQARFVVKPKGNRPEIFYADEQGREMPLQQFMANAVREGATPAGDAAAAQEFGQGMEWENRAASRIPQFLTPANLRQPTPPATAPEGPAVAPRGFLGQIMPSAAANVTRI